MGIFDQLKKLKNYISGSGAQLHLELDTSTLLTDGKVLATVLCQVKEHDLLVDKLYLKLKAEEKVRYRESNTSGGKNRKHHGSSNKSAYVVTFKEELVIDKNFKLHANGEYEWQAEFLIPQSVPGTYRGVNASHEWQILAGLSKKGNDPDSGWVIFDV